MRLSYLLILLALLNLMSGCGGSVFTPKERRTAFMHNHESVPVKESSLLQVKSLSRDLVWCQTKANSYVLAEIDFQRLSKQSSNRKFAVDTKISPDCFGTFSLLSQQVDRAHDAGNSAKAIFQTMLDGQAAASAGGQLGKPK